MIRLFLKNLYLYKYLIILTKPFSFRTLLLTFIFSYMAVISIGPIFLNNRSLFNEVTVLLGLGIGLLLVLSITLSGRYLFDQMSIIILFFLIFILPRITSYLFIPAAVRLPFGDGVNASTINAGLLYVLLGTLFFIAGMLIANVIFRPYLPLSSAATGNPSRYSNKAIMTIFFIVAAIQLYVTLGMGISPYGKMRPDTYNSLFQIMRGMLELDSVFIFVLGTLLFQQKTSGQSKLGYLIVVLGCYIFITSLSGSRVATLRALIAITIILLLLQSNFRTTVVKSVGVIILLGGLGLSLFPFATMSRIYMAGAYHNIPDPYSYAETESKELRNWHKAMGKVFNRLGVVLDYPILILTQPGDPEAKAKYLNLQYPLKNIANLLVPGTVFPEAQLSTSRVIDVIYRGGDEVGMYERYFSEFWTLWGLAYAYFGYLGGLFVILFLGFIIHSLYASIIMLFSGMLQFYLRIWLLLYVTMGIIGNGGIDSAFWSLFIGLLQFVTLYIFVSFLNDLYNKSGNLITKTIRA